jgi:hypothetical protein
VAVINSSQASRAHNGPASEALNRRGGDTSIWFDWMA